METQQSAVSQPQKFTVLVEEEAIIRHLWSEHYRKNGWPLEVFENPLDFLKQIDRFRNREEKFYFFFDQDFGRVRDVGTQLARAVKGLNKRQTVSLITRHIPLLFQKEVHEGLIQYVFDKYPEVLFGENFDDRKLKENPALSKIKERAWNDLNPTEMELGSSGKSFRFTLENHFPSLAPKPKENPVVCSPPIRVEKHTETRIKDSWWRKFVFGGVPT